MTTTRDQYGSQIAIRALTFLLKTSAEWRRALDFPQQTHTQNGIHLQAAHLFPEQKAVHCCKPHNMCVAFKQYIRLVWMTILDQTRMRIYLRFRGFLLLTSRILRSRLKRSLVRSPCFWIYPNFYRGQPEYFALFTCSFDCCKQHQRAACPKGMLEFKFCSIPDNHSLPHIMVLSREVVALLATNPSLPERNIPFPIVSLKLIIIEAFLNDTHLNCSQ